MSINKLISIKNPIVSAMNLLGIDHDKNIPFFTELAVYGEKEIGSAYQYVTQREVLTISNCVACLPCNAVYLEVAILGDLGNDCGDLKAIACGTGVNLPSSFGTVDNTFLVVDMGDAAHGGGFRGYVDFSIQNNKMVFTSNRDGQKITIQYLGYKLDCDGFVEISENHVQAIKWYIVWNYFFRKFGINNYETMKMKMAKEEWERECAHARAQDAELTPSQRSKIVNMYHNPMSGIGLGYGMNTTLGNGINIW